MKHEGTLRIVYQDYHSFFTELLKKDSSLRIRQRNLKLFLVTEMFRSVLYGTETASFIGSNTWKALSNGCKDAASLKSFKENFKRWIPKNRPCSIEWPLMCSSFIRSLTGSLIYLTWYVRKYHKKPSLDFFRRTPLTQVLHHSW